MLSGHFSRVSCHFRGIWLEQTLWPDSSKEDQEAACSGGFTVNRNKLLPLRKVLSLIKVEFLGIQKARIS